MRLLVHHVSEDQRSDDGRVRFDHEAWSFDTELAPRDFFAWAFGMGFIMFKLISAIFGMRVSAEEEMKGLDITEHKADAYSGFQIFSNE